MSLKEKTTEGFIGLMGKTPKFQDYYDYVKPTLNGQYAYIGPVFTFSKDNDISYKRYITVMLLCTFVMLPCSVGSGLLYIAGMNTIWQVLPLAFELLFAFMTGWAVIRMAFTKQPMKIFAFRPTSEAIPKRSRFTVVAAAIGFVAISTYVFVNGWDERVIPTMIYIALKMVVCLAAGLIYKLSTVNVWDSEDISEAL